MAQWLSWLERRPVTAEVTGSSPVWVGKEIYKVRNNITYGDVAVTSLLRNLDICRSGGIGRRPGLKIPWVVIPVPVRPRPAALKSI